MPANGQWACVNRALGVYVPRRASTPLLIRYRTSDWKTVIPVSVIAGRSFGNTTTRAPASTSAFIASNSSPHPIATGLWKLTIRVSFWRSRSQVTRPLYGHDSHWPRNPTRS